MEDNAQTNATDTRSVSTFTCTCCCNFKANTVARAAPRRVRLSGADPSVSRVHAGKVSFTTCPDKRKRENGQPKARFSHDRLSRSFLTAQDIRVLRALPARRPRRRRDTTD